jgi:hypothetical protein
LDDEEPGCRMSGSKDLGARRAMKKSWCGAAARG